MKVKHAGNNFIITELPSQLAPPSLPDLTTHQGGGLYPGHSAKFLAGPLESPKEIRLKRGKPAGGSSIPGAQLGLGGIEIPGRSPRDKDHNETGRWHRKEPICMTIIEPRIES